MLYTILVSLVVGPSICGRSSRGTSAPLVAITNRPVCLAMHQPDGTIHCTVTDFKWRKWLAIALLAWSTLDLAGAILHAAAPIPATTGAFILCSPNSGTPAGSEGYCDGDCIFCSSVIRPTRPMYFAVLTRLARLEIATKSDVYETFTAPIDHPPQG